MDEIGTTFHPRHFLENTPKNLKYRKCVLCGKYVSTQSNFYYCRICDFPFHKDCATTLLSSNLTINHPEIHEHTLNFIRQRNSFMCDACGKSVAGILNIFGCLPCDFFIHRSCIFLPRVIKITRHSHRLCHTFCIPDEKLCCGVCRKNLIIGYGGYICIKKVCNYVVHSDCATRKEVWDGKDVEKELDEKGSNSEVDLVSFIEIDGRYIRHFSHDHDLILGLHADSEEIVGKLCQACILPLDFGNILGCKQCDFALHDTCAHLPRKMEHILHRHPLTLQVNTMKTKEGFFTCSTCDQDSCGFMYQCSQEGCGFKIDIKCASFVEPFYVPSKSRPHVMTFQLGANPFSPFFLTQFGDDQNLPRCNACSESSQTMATYERYIHYDFKCVTLPGLTRYKYDTHPLTLDQLFYKNFIWCEICEEKIPINRFFYTCENCSTNLHVECILGKHRYLKSGHKIKVNGLDIQIASNNGLSRSICHRCHCLCQDKLIFINGIYNICFCSINCINS